MNIRTKLPAALAALLAVVVIAGCGDDDGTPSSAGNRTDTAFVADMVPHHEGAIEMAELAGKHAEHAEIRALATDIIEAQEAEVAVLKRIGADLDDEGVAGGHMGMSAEDMGMAGDMAMLGSAKPFDRAFIDMMIPHHEGAIRMARRELEDGAQPELRTMAKAIIAAQGREITRMRTWRKRWYGSAGDGAAATTGHGGSMMGH